MKSKLFYVTSLMTVFSLVGTASALCHKSSKCSVKKGASVVTAKVVVDGRSDNQDAASTGTKSPCRFSAKKGCKKSAALTAAGKPCSGKCATCPDCKKNNFTNCTDCPKCKSAALTASKTPCGPDCKKGCCNKSAKVAAGKSPCSAKGNKSLARFAAGNGKTKRCPLTGQPIKEEDCPIGKKVNAVLASFPTMKYKVGDDVTGCFKSASARAKESGKAMKFVVGDDIFETQNDASARLVSLYEKEISNLTSMQFAVGGDCFRCPVTAKGKAKDSGKKIAYRVGGFDFPERKQAKSALKQIAEAVADVNMTYKVGDKSFCCNKMASVRVKETSSTMSFVVGDQETTSEFAARIILAEAKIRTIIRTAEAATGS